MLRSKNHSVKCTRAVFRALAVLACVMVVPTQASVVQDLSFTSRSGGKFEIRVDFDEVPEGYKGYTVEKPARIALDFPSTQSALDRKRFILPYGNATAVMLVEAGDRTRMVVNLLKLVPYETRVQGNSLFVTVGEGGQSDYVKPASDPNTLNSKVERVLDVEAMIDDLQFQRTPDGEGRLILTLTDPDVDVNVLSEAGDIKVQFKDTSVPERLLRRFDVTDFATPVHSVDVNTTELGAVLTLKTASDFDYLAYQTDNQYVLSVKSLTPEEVEDRRSEFAYVGDRISLNFQDIEVRAVLQLIADFTELNLVASDTVMGSITLRLQNVPWDQALELVLKTRGLDKRQIGNVLMVAPADEIVDLFSAGSEDGGSLISARGSVIVDPRTNSLIVTETSAKLAEIRTLIDLVDIPIRQVMIEARIVIAQSNLDEQLGIRWGGGYTNNDFDGKGNALTIG